MFEVLAEAIEELEVPADSAALARVLHLQDRLAAKVTMAVAAFDAAGLWDVDGDTSQTAWLRRNAGMTSRDAAVVTRTTRRLCAAPVTVGAWLAGELSGGQVGKVRQTAACVPASLTPAPPAPRRGAARRVGVIRGGLHALAGGRSAPEVNAGGARVSDARARAGQRPASTSPRCQSVSIMPP